MVMIKKVCIYPVIGSIIGSLGYMLTKDVIKILKEKQNIKEYKFNWKRLFNYGILVGFLSGLKFGKDNRDNIDNNHTLIEENKDIVVEKVITENKNMLTSATETFKKMIEYSAD